MGMFQVYKRLESNFGVNILRKVNYRFFGLIILFSTISRHPIGGEECCHFTVQYKPQVHTGSWLIRQNFFNIFPFDLFYFRIYCNYYYYFFLFSTLKLYLLKWPQTSVWRDFWTLDHLYICQEQSKTHTYKVYTGSFHRNLNLSSRDLILKLIYSPLLKTNPNSNRGGWES